MHNASLSRAQVYSVVGGVLWSIPSEEIVSWLEQPIHYQVQYADAEETFKGCRLLAEAFSDINTRAY